MWQGLESSRKIDSEHTLRDFLEAEIGRSTLNQGVTISWPGFELSEKGASGTAGFITFLLTVEAI